MTSPLKVPGVAMTPEQFEAILVDLASGTPTHKAIKRVKVCKRVFWACLVDAELRDRYAKAKASGLERMAEETLRIADTPHEGDVVTMFADGSLEIKSGDMLRHRQLQVDTRKWYLSKVAPKMFGDQVGQQSSSSPAETARAIRETLGILFAAPPPEEK